MGARNNGRGGAVSQPQPGSDIYQRIVNLANARRFGELNALLDGRPELARLFEVLKPSDTPAESSKDADRLLDIYLQTGMYRHACKRISDRVRRLEDAVASVRDSLAGQRREEALTRQVAARVPASVLEEGMCRHVAEQLKEAQVTVPMEELHQLSSVPRRLMVVIISVFEEQGWVKVEPSGIRLTPRGLPAIAAMARGAVTSAPPFGIGRTAIGAARRPSMRRPD
jgi:hypothetical protein